MNTEGDVRAGNVNPRGDSEVGSGEGGGLVTIAPGLSFAPVNRKLGPWQCFDLRRPTRQIALGQQRVVPTCFEDRSGGLGPGLVGIGGGHDAGRILSGEEAPTGSDLVAVIGPNLPDDLASGADGRDQQDLLFALPRAVETFAIEGPVLEVGQLVVGALEFRG